MYCSPVPANMWMYLPNIFLLIFVKPLSVPFKISYLASGTSLLYCSTTHTTITTDIYNLDLDNLDNLVHMQIQDKTKMCIYNKKNMTNGLRISLMLIKHSEPLDLTPYLAAVVYGTPDFLQIIHVKFSFHFHSLLLLQTLYRWKGLRL